MIDTILQKVTTNAVDVHTAVLHADTDLDLFAEPPEESELCENEVWKLHKT